MWKFCCFSPTWDDSLHSFPSTSMTALMLPLYLGWTRQFPLLLQPIFILPSPSHGPSLTSPILLWIALSPSLKGRLATNWYVGSLVWYVGFLSLHTVKYFQFYFFLKIQFLNRPCTPEAARESTGCYHCSVFFLDHCAGTLITLTPEWL